MSDSTNRRATIRIPDLNELLVGVEDNNERVLIAALAYAEAGFYLVPVTGHAWEPPSEKNKGRSFKAPSKEFGGWQHAASNRAAQMHTWFGPGAAFEGRGFGAVPGRSGHVVIDVDRPELVPEEVRDFLLDSRPPIMASRDIDLTGIDLDTELVRGHYWYEVPGDPIEPGKPMIVGSGVGLFPQMSAEQRDIALAMGEGSTWGEVRSTAGFIVMPPTLRHDGNGTAYSWLRTDVSIPVFDPWGWLSGPGEKPEHIFETEREVVGFVNEQAMHGPDDSPLIGWARKELGDTTSRFCRHQRALVVVDSVIRDGIFGLYKAGPVLDDLRDNVWVPMMLEGRLGGRPAMPRGAAVAEWEDLIRWSTSKFSSLYRSRTEIEKARASYDAKGLPVWLAGEEPPEDFDRTPWLLPASFWNASPLLQRIRDEGVLLPGSPDGLLGFVLARVVAHHGPQVTVPSFNGLGRSSINIAFALVGHSGSGKSLAMQSARHLVPNFAGEETGVGTGEGLAETYWGEYRRSTGEQNKDGSDKTAMRRERSRARVMVSIDDVDSLTAQAARSASTLIDSLLNFLQGESVKMTYATKEKQRPVERGTYRFVLATGVQPGRSKVLLSKEAEANGLAQRFAWLSVEGDSEIDMSRYDEMFERLNGLDESERAIVDLPALDLDNETEIVELGYERVPALPEEHIEVPADMLREVVELGMKSGNLSKYPEVAGRQHDGRLKVKIAAAMCLLHGRREVSDLDWALAQEIIDTGRALRAHVGRLGAEEAAAEAQARGRVEGMTAIARDEVVGEKRVENAAGGAARHVAKPLGKACPVGGHTRRCAKKAIDPAYRAEFGDDGIEHALAQGWVEETDGVLTAGSEQPPARG